MAPKQPDDPGIVKQVDERADRFLRRVVDSKWSALWVLLFWLSGYATGHFHFNIALFIYEILWFL